VPTAGGSGAPLARSHATAALGCTQISEILYTPGVALVAPLPAAFELATVYAVAVGRDAGTGMLARQFAAALAGPASAELRRAGGFDA
jgi:molybdate transport system substrate-binding protein